MPQKTGPRTLPLTNREGSAWPEAIKPNRRISPFDFTTGKGHPRFLFIIEGERIIKINFDEAITWSPREGFVKYVSMDDDSEGKYHVSRSRPCDFTVNLFKEQLADGRGLDPEVESFVQRHPEVLSD